MRAAGRLGLRRGAAGPGGAANGCRAGGWHPRPLCSPPPWATRTSSPAPPCARSPLPTRSGWSGGLDPQHVWPVAEARVAGQPGPLRHRVEGPLSAADPGESPSPRSRPAGGQLCPRRTPHTDPPRDLWPAGQQSSVLWAEPGRKHSLGGLPRVCGSASAHGTWIGWHLASPTCAPFLPAPPSAAGVGAAWAGSGRGAGGATGRGPSFRAWWVCRRAEASERGPRSGGGSHGRKGTRRRGGRRSPGAPRHAVRGGRARRSSCSGVGRSHTPRRCRSVSPQHADRPQEARARGLPAVRSVQPWPQTQRGPGLPSGGRPSPRPRHGSAARPDPLVWASHVGSHTARERLHPASSASAVGPCEVRASR